MPRSRSPQGGESGNTCVNNRIRDIVIPSAVAAFWGTAFVAIKVGLAYFTPAQLVTLRFVLATAGFLALYATRVIKWRVIARSDLPRFALVVASGLVAYHLCLAHAEARVSASLASLLTQLAPVLIVIVESLRRRVTLDITKALGVALAATGSVMLIWGSGDLSLSNADAAGIALALAPPACFAGFMLWSKPLVSRYGAANLTAQSIAVASVVFGLVAYASSSEAPALLRAPLSAWIAVVALAGLSTVAGYTLWFNAIERRGAAAVAMYLYLVPGFAVIGAVLLLDESLGWLQLLGGCVVMIGVSLSKLKAT